MSNQTTMPKHKKDVERYVKSNVPDTKEQHELTPDQKFAIMFENFKFQTIRNGVIKEFRDRQYFMKKGEKRRKKIAEAKQKARQNQKRRRRGK